MLRPFTDPKAALDDPEIAVWGTDSNTLSVSEYRRGDVEAALAASAHVVEEMFRTQRIEHAFLEPEATLAVPDPAARHDARLLGRPGRVGRPQPDRLGAGRRPELITVELVSNGGAFGGKEDMANQAHAALAAWLLQRPVKCVLSREESLLMHPKRHPIEMAYRVGLRCRGPADRGPRPDGRRLGRLRVGRA